MNPRHNELIIRLNNITFTDLTDIPRNANIPLYTCNLCQAITIHPKLHARFHIEQGHDEN